MPPERPSDAEQNPYNPYEETDQYRAFQNGWRARCEQTTRSEGPHPFAHAGSALAWLDGWRAAQGVLRSAPRSEQSDRPRKNGRAPGSNTTTP